MTPKEQEIAIKELEERVDRLRNLYEQYFLGFERLEPTVPRKDVDRRLALMRKEQIRNTAMRFRFNVITQKYNTYAMHWVRICRQIEEGTYKRHVRRAKARFGDVNNPSPNDRDYAIDIDVGDFDVDMDEVLAEADAAAAGYERTAPDTLPPPPASERSPSARTPIANTPGTSFAVKGRREVDRDEPLTPPALHVASERSLRQVALPPGAKPRVVLRKREDNDHAPPSLRAPAPSSPHFAGPERVAPASANMPASVESPGPQGSGRIPIAAPASGNAVPASADRIPVAQSTSSGRHAVAPHGDRQGPQIRPLARPLGSGGRMPAAQPLSPPPAATSQPRQPIPPPSSPRMPVAPIGPTSTRRLPGSPPPGSSPMLPAAPASSPKMPPASRGPMPSSPGAVSEKDIPSVPQSHPSVPPRARAPLPLPSQAARPKKE